MHRVLEAVFRRPMRLLLLTILLPVLSVAVVLFLPRTYHSTATLWAFQRYQIIGASGAEANLQDTEAGTQATALNELLHTQTFALAVANETSLPSTLDPAVRADPQLRDATLFDDISKNVVATALGTNSYSIAYVNKNAKLAADVVAAVIDQFGKASVQFSVIEGQNLRQSYQTSLVTAEQNLKTATDAEESYLQANPDLTSNVTLRLNDPQYQQLDAQRQQALSVVQNLQNQIATVTQEINQLNGGPTVLYKVLDVPQVPTRPDSRTKEFLLGGALGLLVALLVGTVAIIVTLRRDRSIYVPLDLAKLTQMPVVMQIPHLSRHEVRATLAPAPAAPAATSEVVSAKHTNGHLNGNNRSA